MSAVLHSEKQTEKNRIHWQCRRGMLELDILLQDFYRTHGDSLSDNDVELFTDLLACSDEQLYGYLMGRVVATDSTLAAMINKIRNSSYVIT